VFPGTIPGAGFGAGGLRAIVGAGGTVISPLEGVTEFSGDTSTTPIDGRFGGYLNSSPETPCHFPTFGGSGEIRTHERLATLPVFKTGAIDHSATLPADCGF
jgi:hypothetical protein